MTIRINRLVVNPASRIATIDEKRLRLTTKEYDILELLSLRKGTTVTKEMFLNHISTTARTSPSRRSSTSSSASCARSCR